MAMIELVDYNDIYNAGKTIKKKSTRRSRRGGSKAADQVINKVVAQKEEE